MIVEAINSIFEEEGGYVNDKDDSGGATNRGIIQSTYDAYRQRKKLPTRPVLYSTRVEAFEIYESIWRDCSAIFLADGLNLVHFDFAVNAGNRRAAITLQKTLGVTQDGKIGPKTLDAADAIDPKLAVEVYSNFRREFYNNLAESRPKDKKFLKGWLARTNRVESKALKLIKPDGTNTPKPARSSA